MNARGSDAEAFARVLVVQAIWPAAAVAAATFFTTRLCAASPGSFGFGSILLAAVFGISGLAAILLSLNLLFDAFLFRVIASRAGEAEGCAAVDDLLARLRLTRRPDRLRGVEERIAGTRRLVRRQRAALGVCITTCLALWLTRSA